MAWISVHSGVFGPKLRDLYRSLNCSETEALGILNILWLWGLENANKDGLIINAEKEDIERAIYAHNANSKIAPGLVVDALVETGWIDKENDGFFIHDWEMWQDQWYKAKERRENEAKRKRESRKRKQSLDSGEEKADNPTDSPADTPEDKPKDVPQELPKTPEESPPPVPEEPKYTPNFEVFWNSYPRKIGKGEAYKKFKTRLKDGYSEEELITAAKNYAMVCKRMHTENQYIKHPRTFLSDNLPFTDYLPKKPVEVFEQEKPTGANPFGDWKGDS